jgi:hypothetical protein
VCMIDDCERAEFYHRKQVRARKPHKCSECSREIAAGELYERVVGKWEGHVDTILACAQCQEAREWLSVVCDGYAHGRIYEDLREHVDHYGDELPTLATLADLMRARWIRDGVRMTSSEVEAVTQAALPPVEASPR